MYIQCRLATSETSWDYELPKNKPSVQVIEAIYPCDINLSLPPNKYQLAPYPLVISVTDMISSYISFHRKLHDYKLVFIGLMQVACLNELHVCGDRAAAKYY